MAEQAKHSIQNWKRAVSEKRKHARKSQTPISYRTVEDTKGLVFPTEEEGGTMTLRQHILFANHEALRALSFFILWLCFIILGMVTEISFPGAVGSFLHNAADFFRGLI